MTFPQPQPAQSAPEIAYRWLKDHIITLPREEDAFLNEASLATATGTSRTPVREALLRLEAEGFLKRIPHKGAYVPPIGDPDVTALMQARSVVEKWAASANLEGQQRLAARLRAIIEQQREVQEDAPRFLELDISFHSVMVDAARNPLLSDFYHSLRQRQLRVGIRAVSSEDDRSDNVLREHTAILEAVESGDLGAVHAAIDQHLDSTLNAVLAP